MMTWVRAVWSSIGPRMRALMASLLVPAGVLVLAFIPEWLAIIVAVVWLVMVLCGTAAAAWEHRRDVRRDLRSWRTVPHPSPCPHCRDRECAFPPSRYGLAQAPDAHLWDENGHRIATGIAGRLVAAGGEN